MNVILGILVGVVGLYILNRQQLTAQARLALGPGYGNAPGGNTPPAIAYPVQPPRTAAGVAPPQLFPASTFSPPSLTATNTAQEAIGAAGAGIGLLQSGALGATLAGAKAIPIVGSVVAVAAAIVGPILAKHKQRVAAATSENSHNGEMTAIFDEAIPKIVQYWNQTHDQVDTISELKQLYQYLYNTMKSRTGVAGTAWSDSVGQAGQCNKQCTAGCCIFWGDFAGGGAPAYTGINGLIAAVQGGGHRSVTMPKVYPGKYSPFTRPLYTVTLS